jgi:Flp pilus assembly protein TadD
MTDGPASSRTFDIGLADFDLELLPAQARDVGSPAFAEAVTDYFRTEFADVGGLVEVEVTDDRIRVTWRADDADQDLFDRATTALSRGDLAAAVPLLQALVAVEPTHAEAHYNLGMALSDLGTLDQAQLHLLKVTHLDPDNVNALVALGVALYRAGDIEAARRRLTQAVKADPENGYAHRNLAAVLGNLGEGSGAITHLREAARLLQEDQASIFGLAQALENFGDDADRAEVDRLYQETIALDTRTELAELARQARSRIAQQEMRRTSGGPRMDAVMYCLSALQRFESMSPEEVRGVGVEIALLGQQGLEVNNPDVTYSLRTLDGQFTGLHLMSFMYVAFQQVAPELDIGFDLAEEYEMARQLHGARRG